MSMIAMSPAELLMMMMLWLPSQPQGQPADANTVFRYVPHQASLAVGLDAGSLATSAMQGFQDLGQQPFLRRSRELSRRYRLAQQAVQRALRMMKMMGNIDPIRDLRYVSASLAVGQGKPRFVVAVGGNLKAGLAERMALGARTEKAQKLPNGLLYRSRRSRKPSFGWTNDNVLLIGQAELLKTLLQRRPRPTKLARLAISQYDRQTLLTVAVRPDKQFRRALRKAPPFIRALGNDFSGLALSVRYDGARMAIQGANGRVLARYRKLLDGVGDYMAAAELVARGSLKIGDGLLSPKDARLLPPSIRGLVSNKNELLRYLRKYVPLKRNPSHTTRVDARRRLVRLDYRGSRYAGLVPFLAGAGFFISGVKSSAPMAMPRRRRP